MQEVQFVVSPLHARQYPSQVQLPILLSEIVNTNPIAHEVQLSLESVMHDLQVS